MTLHDQAARDRIGCELDRTFVVEAAAGTGKTTALVSRIVAVLAAGTPLSRIIAVTFTDKAAGEMKLRLRTSIEEARLDGTATVEVRARLDGALAELEAARIATIHSLAADFLRERPVEARIDPLFEVVAEESSATLFDEAFERWFQRMLADPPEGARRVLRRRPRGRNERGPKAELRDAAWTLADHRDFPTPWERRPFAREARLDEEIGRLRELGQLASQALKPGDFLAQSLAEVQRFVEDLDRRERVMGRRDYDGLEAQLRQLFKARHWKWVGFRDRWFAKGLAKESVQAQRDEAREALRGLLDASDADLAPCLQRELAEVASEYERLKQQHGCLDFLDLLLRARDLLRDSKAVRNELQRRYTHLFVDEFQDTDPLQAEILLLLAADDPDETNWLRVRPEPGKVFLVGDPKQAIYRFRRADIALYQRVKEALQAQGAEVLHLTTSFRAVPSLQQAVNAAFAPAMASGTGSSQAEYVPLERQRDEYPAQPTLVGLPAPRPYGSYGKITKEAIEESYADAVGAYVAWLLKSDWTVTERGRGGRVPIEARHICIIFRQLQSWGDDLTRPYVRALEGRRVPHVLVGGRSFHAREEVLALRNALEAIERPADEFSVFATLRGPFVALADEMLLAFRDQVGHFDPMRRPGDAALPAGVQPVAEALALIRRLHVGRNHRPIAETVRLLLAETRAHAGIAIWPAGEQALANVLRLHEQARRYEASGAISFRGFVDHLANEAAEGTAGEAPIVEEGTDGVRLMTVHKAKGLEFPVVILANTAVNETHERPGRHVEPERRLWAQPVCGCTPAELLDHTEEELRRDHEEAVRVAYVAATRARDLLVAPVVGDEQRASWLTVLNPALYPKPERERLATASAGCPDFGKETVLNRPDKQAERAVASVAPGQHAPQLGEHRVCWWDPQKLDLGREPEMGLAQERLLEASGRHEESLAAYEAWRRDREVAIEKGRQALVHTLAVSKVAAVQSPTKAVEVARVAGRRADRPAGRRFGALVHGILGLVDFHGAESSLEAIAAAQTRYLGSAEEEQKAAIEVVRATLTHPLLRLAADCPDVWRETPVCLRLEDRTVAEGVLDLAYRLDGEWVVVDYKTEEEDPAATARYRRQVGLYVQGIREATGGAARGVVLFV